MDYVSFASDYMEGCHPAILELMRTTNRDQHAGYGTDEICASARARIQAVCACPNAARSLAKHVGFSFWEKTDRDHTVVRFASSWATTAEDVATLARLL